MYKAFEDQLIAKHFFKDIGNFYFYQNFMISEIHEGVVITLDKVTEVTHKYTIKYYNNSIPFVFISNRINSYSLEPTIHFKTKILLPNTKGYAVVTYNDLNKKVAQFEQNFLHIPTGIFADLNSAVQWAQNLITLD